MSRVFPMAAGPVAALRDVSIGIAEGEYLGVVGPSGCGKSTLLHVLGCVDVPTTGPIKFQGRDVSGLSDSDRSRLRLREIGFVFQRFFLLPMLTAFENVELPQAEAGVARTERRARARELLDFVGLGPPRRPSSFRAVRRRDAAGCDCPRAREQAAAAAGGRTDGRAGSGDGRANHLPPDRLHADGTSVVVVTHDPAVASRARRLITMRDGRIVEDSTR